jgi:hypothetical protein
LGGEAAWSAAGRFGSWLAGLAADPMEAKGAKWSGFPIAPFSEI